MLPREKTKHLHQVWVYLEETTTRLRMSYGVAESDLLTEGTVLRRVQGAMTYKVRTGMDFNLHFDREVNGSP
jgi:hypothetical protein